MLVHDHDGKSRFELAPERSIHAKRAYSLCFAHCRQSHWSGVERVSPSFRAVAITCLVFALVILACSPEEQSVLWQIFLGQSASLAAISATWFPKSCAACSSGRAAHYQCVAGFGGKRL